MPIYWIDPMQPVDTVIADFAQDGCNRPVTALQATNAQPGILRRLSCLLAGGHDEYVAFDGGRMRLVCVSCKRESAGWEVRQP